MIKERERELHKVFSSFFFFFFFFFFFLPLWKELPNFLHDTFFGEPQPPQLLLNGFSIKDEVYGIERELEELFRCDLVVSPGLVVLAAEGA